MTLKRLVTLVTLNSLVFGVPASADLHFTTRTEAHKVTAPEGTSPTFATTADMLVKMLLPEGSAEVTTWVTAQGSRVEFTNATMMVAAGTVLLFVAGELSVMLNPRDRSYSKMSMPTPQTVSPQMQELMAKMKPDLTVTRTGEYMTIAGFEAEHVTLTSTQNISLPGGRPLAPGIASTINSNVDLWVAHQYDAYATRPVPMLASMTPFPAQGFTMRSVVRSSLMTGFEIETVVTKIVEEPAPADAFQIPADYKEVPSPVPAVGATAGPASSTP
jgi:hypothetical protein